jgi:hypothetical protein
LRVLVARRDALDAMRSQERNQLEVAADTVRSGIEAHLAYLEQALTDIEAAIRRRIFEPRPATLRQASALLTTS